MRRAAKKSGRTDEGGTTDRRTGAGSRATSGGKIPTSLSLVKTGRAELMKNDVRFPAALPSEGGRETFDAESGREERERRLTGFGTGAVHNSPCSGSVRSSVRDAAFFVTFFSSTEEKKSSHRSPPPPIVFQEYKTKKKRTAMMKTPRRATTSLLPDGREVQVKIGSVRPSVRGFSQIRRCKNISKFRNPLRNDRRTTPLNSYASGRGRGREAGGKGAIKM